jgi:hypothetical protein
MDAVLAPADVPAGAKVHSLAQPGQAPVPGAGVSSLLLDQFLSMRASSWDTDVPRLAARIRKRPFFSERLGLRASCQVVPK